jgi:hypothetical protein
METARREAEAILAQAQERATYLIEEQGLTSQAEEISREMVRQAEAEAESTRRGADAYAAEVLQTLERELTKTLKSIKLGLELLDGRGVVSEGPDGGNSQGDLDAYDQSADAQPIHG